MSCSLYHHIAVDINIRLARNLLQTAQKDFYPMKNLRCGIFVCPSSEIFKTTIGSKFTIIKTNFLSCSNLNYLTGQKALIFQIKTPSKALFKKCIFSKKISNSVPIRTLNVIFIINKSKANFPP